MYRDLGFIRVAGHGSPRREDDRATRRRPTPTSSTRTSRSWPTCRPAAGSSASTAWSSPTSAAAAGPPARLGRRARQVDGAHVRREPRDPPRQHAPDRAPVRSGAGTPRSLAPRGVGAPLGAPPRSAPSAAREQRSTGAKPGHPRRPGSGPGARLPEGHRLRRGSAQPPDHRHRQHLDRDDAVQLPPAPARQEGQGGRARGRRHADGVQHRRGLGRDHDGHRGHEDLADQPRGDRRLDRAGGARPHVRRRDRAVGLRQDDPRLRDGAGAARRAVA